MTLNNIYTYPLTATTGGSNSTTTLTIYTNPQANVAAMIALGSSRDVNELDISSRRFVPSDAFIRQIRLDSGVISLEPTSATLNWSPAFGSLLESITFELDVGLQGSTTISHASILIAEWG